MTRSSYVAYGVAFDVDVLHECGADGCSPTDLADEVAARMPPGVAIRTDGSDSAGSVSIACRGTTFTVTDTHGERHDYEDSSQALHAIDQAVRSIVAVHAPGLTFVHAGAVGIDGRALVLPGKSFAGKTTLVAALVRAGADYLSDEYAVIDDAGLVHPYPRRLSLRGETGRREVTAAELGARTAQRAVPIGLVAAIQYRAGATWEVNPGDQAACAESLLANAVAAQIRPSDVLATSALVARSTCFVAGVRGETDDAVPRLIGLCNGKQA